MKIPAQELFITAIASSLLALGLASCNSGGGGVTVVDPSSSSAGGGERPVVDYSKGAAFNAKLGRGVNFGNAWDSKGWGLDEGWNNPIPDEWFPLVKSAGFQSVRLPVRWSYTADTEPPYAVQAERVAGVKEDVSLAINNGLLVIINQHHYEELFDAADAATLEKEKARFCAIWEQISDDFKDYSNDSLAFEVLNEAQGKVTSAVLNELISCAYDAIRAKNPDRTIIINPWMLGKFQAMSTLELPQDGNMIVSGHYYEPFGFSHQGQSSQYPCGTTWGSVMEQQKIRTDLESYVALAKERFPGADGGSIPLNIGEFGAASPSDSKCPDISNEQRGKYVATITRAAEDLGMSWHVWGMAGVNFDIYDKTTDTWIPEMLKGLIP